MSESTADGQGPITSQEEADSVQQEVDDAEAQYPNEEERDDAVKSLIASGRSRLATWQAQQEGESTENADDSLR